jgi:hypothetical protein
MDREGISLMNRLTFLASLLALSTFQCSSASPLTEAEKAKLDRPLINLITGDTTGEQPPYRIRPDGTHEYSVIVRSEMPEKIKELGVTVTSVIGNVIVAHVSVEEIRKIAALPSVSMIETGSTNKIQQ